MWSHHGNDAKRVKSIIFSGISMVKIREIWTKSKGNTQKQEKNIDKTKGQLDKFFKMLISLS